MTRPGDLRWGVETRHAVESAIDASKRPTGTWDAYRALHSRPSSEHKREEGEGGA